MEREKPPQRARQETGCSRTFHRSIPIPDGRTFAGRHVDEEPAIRNRPQRAKGGLDLILTDIAMPGDMDGLFRKTLLRKRQPW